MRILDRRFHKHVARYLLQCALATLAVALILLILSEIQQAVIAASLGSSAFIAFAMPHTNAARSRYLVGGYVCGMASGVAMQAFGEFVGRSLGAGAWEQWPIHGAVLFGAAAVGLAIFLMVITNTEHPPAGGLALGVVLAQWDALALAVPIVGIVALSLARLAMKPILINLIEVPQGEGKDHDSA